MATSQARPVRLPRLTGASTFIGALGINLNFAHGMDFDFSTGTLYAALYSGGGVGQWATIDTTTGAATAPCATTTPAACRGSCCGVAKAMRQCSIGGCDHVYCAPLFSNDGLAGSLRRREIGSKYPLP